MKERPILMSAPMVRASLRDENPKTQTRRVVKVQPNPLIVAGAEIVDRVWCWLSGHDGSIAEKVLGHGRCPYGQPGDRLWVREAWAETIDINGYRLHGKWPDRPHIKVDGEDSDVIIYRADGPWQWFDDDGFATELTHWKLSIHMPRWASRILLEIVDVRVERLQDISKADARAEGLDWVGDGYTPYGVKGIAASWSRDPRESYRVLWESINGPGSWSVNPWVWVLEFRRL